MICRLRSRVVGTLDMVSVKTASFSRALFSVGASYNFDAFLVLLFTAITYSCCGWIIASVNVCE